MRCWLAGVDSSPGVGRGTGSAANADLISSSKKQQAIKKSSKMNGNKRDEECSYGGDTNDQYDLSQDSNSFCEKGRSSLKQALPRALAIVFPLFAIWIVFGTIENYMQARVMPVKEKAMDLFFQDPRDIIANMVDSIEPSLLQLNTGSVANTLEVKHSRKGFRALEPFPLAVRDIYHKMKAPLQQGSTFRLIVEDYPSSTVEEETNGRFEVRSALIPLNQINPRAAKELAIRPFPRFSINKLIHQFKNHGAPDLGPAVSDKVDSISILLSL